MRPLKIKDRCTKKKLKKCEEVARTYDKIQTAYGEEAGAHFTSRDIIYLMTDILLSDTKFNGQNITVYDMAMGTSQMLSCMEERIHALDEDATVTCFGQEFNPSTFANAKIQFGRSNGSVGR